VFVHEDDIKTHDNSLTLPNIFYLFKQDKLVSVFYTYDTSFSEKNLDFYKILEESEQFFILFF
jgi:hypothetical protein